MISRTQDLTGLHQPGRPTTRTTTRTLLILATAAMTLLTIGLLAWTITTSEDDTGTLAPLNNGPDDTPPDSYDPVLPTAPGPRSSTSTTTPLPQTSTTARSNKEKRQRAQHNDCTHPCTPPPSAPPLVNTDPRVNVVVTPEHPVEGDKVTVEIHWEDDEANIAASQSYCHPGVGPNGEGLCTDVAMLQPCTSPVGAARPTPAPGAGVIQFSFIAREGSARWDHSALLRSIPIDHDGPCRTDPYQDHFFASGTIQVAPAGGPAKKDTTVVTPSVQAASV